MQKRFEAEVLNGTTNAVMLAPPCDTWSIARYPALRDSDRFVTGFGWLTGTLKERVENANRMVRWMASLIRKCIARGIIVLLENPWSSRIWKFKPLKALLHRVAHIDFCTCGAPWKKPTGIAIWNGHLADRTCSPVHGICSSSNERHIRLRGKSKGVDMTKHAEAYPKRFAKLLVDAIFSSLRG